jgi:hypothetical protein
VGFFDKGEMMREKVRSKKRLYQPILGLILLVLLLGSAAMAMAAETGKTSEPGRFEVVAGSDDKAYLVDKTTGAVWVLTYRTMATGREPIAIPYKFLLRTPKNQGEFLTESLGADVTLPPSAPRQ